MGIREGELSLAGEDCVWFVYFDEERAEYAGRRR